MPKPPSPRRDAAVPRAAPRRSVNTGQPPLTPGAGPRPRNEALELPHERDEGLRATRAEPDPVIEQAGRDLESGQVDTDLRATPGLDARRREALLRRGA
ncbi:hypothetical protein [Hydrogenophaga sp. 70-12]|uniref:hypothetical protein n=1 Tax=Hydrogenophaga sp. 70-12 TaxID=1895769 RepID=UPI000A7F9603|nr:hypothetical protein [Hydrogenophaga sp. 70-12]